MATALNLSPELEKLYLALRLAMAEGSTPSVRELSAVLNVSYGTVARRIGQLEKLGVLRRKPGHRSIQLLKGKVA